MIEDLKQGFVFNVTFILALSLGGRWGGGCLGGGGGRYNQFCSALSYSQYFILNIWEESVRM